MWRNVTGRLALALLCGPWLSCAGTGATDLPPGIQAARGTDKHDRAYAILRLREEPCPQNEWTGCCQQREQRLEEALKTGEAMGVALALDSLALGCPELRQSATAALDFRAPRVDSADTGNIAVRFAGKLRATDRIYWASAFVDGKHYAGAPLVAGPHELQIEFHVLTAEGLATDSLYRVRTRERVTIEPKQRIEFRVELNRKEAPTTDEFLFRVDLVQLPPPLPATPPPANGVAGWRRKLQAPRFPADLVRDRPWFTHLKVCVSDGGRVDTLAPVADEVHPRLFGLLLDAFLRAEYEPYRVNGKPVPFCQPVRFELRNA